MKIRYIAIEREYGSGGTKIAQETARRCGISCYGREILELTANEQQVSVETLQDYEESVSGSFLYSMFVMAQSQNGNPDLLSREAKLFVAETQMIQNLSRSGPAIFVGHCASQVLREQEGVLKVFIHAEREDKEQRAIRDYGIAPREVGATCRRFNKKRANYYSFCTRKKWNDTKNYDLVLNSSCLGIEGCVEVLTALYRQA